MSISKTNVLWFTLPCFPSLSCSPSFFPPSSFQDLSLCNPEAGRSLLTCLSFPPSDSLLVYPFFLHSFPHSITFYPKPTTPHPSISLTLSIFLYPFPLSPPSGEEQSTLWVWVWQKEQWGTVEPVTRKQMRLEHPLI